MMDTKRFSCTVMHPDLSPFNLLDPFNVLRIKLIAELDTDKLSLITSRGKAKTLISVPFGNTSHVTIQHLSVSSQRLERFRQSLTRLIVLAVVMFIYILLSHSRQPRDVGYYILVTLAGVGLISPLFLLSSGGFTLKNDVVRFHFTPLKEGKPFYLEVEPANEPDIHQMLLSAGLKFKEYEGS